MTHPKLGDILIAAGVIDEFQLRAALGEQRRWGRRLGVTLIKLGFVEERELVRALARQLAMPVAHLEGKRISQAVLDLVPQELAERYMCMPLFTKRGPGGETLYLGMEDPTNLDAIDELAFRSGKRIAPVLVGPSEVCEAIDRFYLRPGADTESLELDVEPDPAEPVSLKDVGGDRSVEWTLPEEPAESSPPTRAAPTAADAVAQLAGADAERVLRALTELLIEKGFVRAEDLLSRLRNATQPAASGDPRG